MAFTFGTPAAQPQTSTPTFSFGGTPSNTAPNQANTAPKFSFGSTPAHGASATQENKPAFSFGASNTQNTTTTIPSFSFGSSNNASGGLFGSTNNQQNAQPNTNTGSSLFGNTSGGLFGNNTAQQPQNQGSSLFGNTLSQPTSSLFNNSQTGQQGGLFGQNTNQQNNNVAQLNQSTQQAPTPQPTLSQSIYGQTINTPQFSWSRPSHPLAQSVMPTFNQTMPQSKIDVTNSYGPLQPASIQDQLLRLKNAWDPSHSDCMFQAYLYNRVAPETASLYTKPDNHKQAAWDDAVARRPDNSVVPFLAVGFSELQTRVQGQQQMINAYRIRMHEIADKLKELDDRHLLHAQPKVNIAKRRHAELSSRALQLAARVQVIKCRGYALRPEEELLKSKLAELLSRLKTPTMTTKVEEIWAKMTLIRARQQAVERDIASKGFTTTIDLDNGDGLQQVEQILNDHNKGLKYVCTTLQRDLDDIDTEIERHKVAKA